MKRLAIISVLSAAAFLLSAVAAAARTDSLTYSATLQANASTGEFAPYMIGSWNADRTTMKNALTADFAIEKPMSSGGRFDWGFGAELLTGCQHPVTYDRYDADDIDWTGSVMRPSPVSLRTLYAEAHYRSLFMLVGMKGFESKIVDSRLSSGDLIRSNNARPIPGVTVGLVDFQDIPFTNGWLQIDGRIMYGKFTDNSFRRKQFNYYNDLIATDIYYTYKYCYFRTRPTERFSAIFGMQAAGQFGGSTEAYFRGQSVRTENRGFQLKDVAKMLFPTLDNGNDYYEGNSLGAWSLRARYRFGNDDELAVCWEKPFEDGSGIGCRNGMDALYGVQYTFARNSWLKSVVAEYLDFRNQSGPLHYAPGDHVDPSITSEATGGDNYYNNDTYGPYVNYGMSIGSPMPVAPVYNLNGYPQYIYNRMRGFHFAAIGDVTPEIGYKVAASWQKGYAMGRIPLPHAKTDFSALAEIGWNAGGLLEGLSVDLRIAFDTGELRGDNFGTALAVRYTGSLSSNK